jgi:hypothetical protein
MAGTLDRLIRYLACVAAAQNASAYHQGITGRGVLEMTTAQNRPKGFVILAIILIVFAIGTMAFWIEFFTSGTVSMSDRPAYLEHEQSFPAADGYMVACALICAVGIIRQRPWGLLFGLLAGSAIIFLGLMDTLYSIQQGIFTEFTAAAGESFVICAICLILGPATIIYVWRNRDYLL